MNFNENIILNTYSENANKQFDEMQNRLSGIESSFQTKMDGNTKGGLIAYFIGTLVWLTVYIICAFLVRNMVDNTLLLISLGIALVLIIFMIIDNIMDFSYYGKISSYKYSILQMRNRVNIGRNSIKANHDAFIASKSSGWNYLLGASPSIPDEASSTESAVATMESLKKGFINGAKNFFFFATIIAITVVGCIAFFPTGSSIITGMMDSSISDDTLMVFNIIALIAVLIGEIILAKLMWSKTDCNVTSVTLLVSICGPIAFLALIAIATLIVMLVMMIVGLVLGILAVLAALACIFGAICGG